MSLKQEREGRKQRERGYNIKVPVRNNAIENKKEPAQKTRYWNSLIKKSDGSRSESKHKN